MNVIKWIRLYFDKPTLKEKNLKPILHFSLLWNLFEYTYFTDNNRLNTKSIINLSIISADLIVEENLYNIFIFFKNRYYIGDVFHEHYSTLILDTHSRNGRISDYDFCKNTISSNDSTKQDKLICTLLIIHRFRNNLFHGRKNPKTLNLYAHIFSRINKFLIHFIETTSENSMINKKRFGEN